MKINMVQVVLVLIVLVNGLFAVSFVRDLIKHKDEAMKEPGNPFAMGIATCIIYFLSTFGISDFALGTVLYRNRKWVSDKKLPGTLNTECVIPVAFMALAYISTIEVEIKTLIVPIVTQVLGAYIGPRFVVKMNVKAIKIFIAIGLAFAAFFIIAGKLGLFASSGTAIELTGTKLILFGMLSFVYGALNNVGIGSYALTMATTVALGLNPAVTFPIMMGACTFSVPVGSMQFIKFGEYSRKITLFAATFGSIGVFFAAFVVKSLDVEMLKWLIVLVLLYTVTSMAYELLIKDKE